MLTLYQYSTGCNLVLRRRSLEPGLVTGRSPTAKRCLQLWLVIESCAHSRSAMKAIVNRQHTSIFDLVVTGRASWKPQHHGLGRGGVIMR